MAEDKQFLEGLLGSDPQDRESNILRGLLGAFVGSRQGLNTGDALAYGLAHGIQGVDAGRQSQAQRDLNRYRMAKPVFAAAGSQPMTYQDGQFAPSGSQVPGLATNSRPSAPIQNIQYRQLLVSQFGDDSDQVKIFDNYVRANPLADAGNVIMRLGVMGTNTDQVIPKGTPPKVAIDTKEGRTITVPAQTPGQIPSGGPRVENLPETKTVSDAKDRLAGGLQDVANNYIQLDQMGGIVNPDKSTGANVAARLKATDFGQSVGGAVGTEEQAIRQKINNSRPMLINHIRQVTGMSARALDSNAELKFYLQMVSDPKVDLLSNLAALDLIDQSFGRGDALKGVVPDALYERIRTRASQMRTSRPWEGGDRSGGPTNEDIRSNTGQVIPQAAIDYLRANPRLGLSFDAKYGKGAAKRILGGK